MGGGPGGGGGGVGATGQGGAGAGGRHGELALGRRRTGGDAGRLVVDLGVGAGLEAAHDGDAGADDERHDERVLDQGGAPLAPIPACPLRLRCSTAPPRLSAGPDDPVVPIGRSAFTLSVRSVAYERGE